MTEELILLSMYGFILLFTAVFAIIQPALVRRDLLFGVTVAAGTRSTPAARRIIRRYQLTTLLLTLAGFAGLVAIFLWLPVEVAVLVTAFAIIGILLISSLPFLWAYFASRRLAATQPAAQPAPESERPTAELRPRHYSDYVPWVWELLPLAIIVATAAYLAVTYPSVPGRFASHFDFNGVPNGYSTKSIASYFTLVWTQLSTWFVITLLAVLVAGARSLPGEAEARFRRVWLRFLFVLKMCVMAMLAAIAIAIGNSALTGVAPSAALILVPVGLLVAILVGSLVLSLRTGQGGTRLSPAAPVTDRMSDKYWILGSFYVNRSDPSLMVERRFGVGWTLNFGNPMAWLVLLLILAAAGASSAIAIIATGR